ncbi:hypothetical protein ScPMuIL_001500 [Solemya velum]
MNKYTMRVVRGSCKCLVSLLIILVMLTISELLNSSITNTGHLTRDDRDMATPDSIIQMPEEIVQKGTASRQHVTSDVVQQKPMQLPDVKPKLVKHVRVLNNTVVWHRKRDFVSEKDLTVVVKVLEVDIYILSAVAPFNHEQRDQYSTLVLTGWDGRQKKLRDTDTNPFCCRLVYGNSEIVTVAATTLPENIAVTRFSSAQYVCPLPGHKPPYVLLEACKTNQSVSLNFSNICNTDCLAKRKHFRIIYPEPQYGRIAMCVKIVYGKMDVQALVEWFEMQKILEVHRVFVLLKDDTQADVVKILQYYRSEGFLEIYQMQFVRKITTPYTHNRPWYIAEGDIARHHCFNVMSGYSYASIIDFDEVFVPKKHQTLIQMLEEDLLPNYQNAAGFKFSNEIFLTDESMPVTESDLFLCRHLYRLRTLTPTPNNRTKVIYIPRWVRWAEDHFIHAKWVYKTYHVPDQIATFHHYRRSCPDYLDCKNEPIFYDDSISKYSGQLRIVVPSVLRRTGFGGT